MKKVIIGIVIGILISGAVYAAATIASDKVSYDNKTSKSSSTNVQGAIDELYSNSLTGKNNIISALANKGFNVNNNSTYSDIVNGINEMPITLSKDEEGNFGYVGDDGGFSSFNSGLTLDLLWSNPDINATFSGQTINLDLSDYDFVIIPLIYITGAGDTYKYRVWASSIVTENDMYRSYNLMAHYGYINGISYERSITARATGVTFSGGEELYSTGRTTSNNVLKPIRIYGCKNIPKDFYE